MSRAQRLELEMDLLQHMNAIRSDNNSLQNKSLTPTSKRQGLLHYMHIDSDKRRIAVNHQRR